jgi:hypothetical protein
MSRKLLIGWYLMPIFTFTFLSVFAQEERVSVSDYYLLHSRTQNFSLCAFLPCSNLALHSENQYLLSELCTASITGCYKNKENAVSASVSHFGYSKYGIMTISTGYARTFAHRVSFGLQLHYLMHHNEIFPNVHSFTFDLSLYGRISKQIGIGVSAYNPANLKYGITGMEKIPMYYILMLDYKINDKVLLAVAASKQLPGFFDITGTIGFKDKIYGFITDFSLKKVGVEFSFWWKKVQFDVGGSFDYRLGFSPNVGINYQFNHTHEVPCRFPLY